MAKSRTKAKAEPKPKEPEHPEPPAGTPVNGPGSDQHHQLAKPAKAKKQKPADAPDSPPRSASEPNEGNLVEVHAIHLNVHGHYRVVELTDEGIVVASDDAAHQRIRVSSDDIVAVYKKA